MVDFGKRESPERFRLVLDSIGGFRGPRGVPQVRMSSTAREATETVAIAYFINAFPIAVSLRRQVHWTFGRAITGHVSPLCRQPGTQTFLTPITSTKPQ